MGDMAAAGHATDLVQWISANWLWVLIWVWILGGSVEETCRRLLKRRRKAIAARRRYRIELALARSGLPYAAPAGQSVLDARTDTALPAAVIPSPPGARPVRGVPGPCRHERIVPVITDDGELCRWICANYPRCTAQFPPDTAIYEPGDGYGDPA